MLATCSGSTHIDESNRAAYRTCLISNVLTGKVDVRHIPIGDADILPETEADLTLEDGLANSNITAEENQ